MTDPEDFEEMVEDFLGKVESSPDSEEFTNLLEKVKYESDRQATMDEVAQELKRRIMMYMATYSGVSGFVQILVDLFSDFGEGTGFSGKPIAPDPFWLAVAAEAESFRVNIERLSEEYNPNSPGEEK